MAQMGPESQSKPDRVSSSERGLTRKNTYVWLRVASELLLISRELVRLSQNGHARIPFMRSPTADAPARLLASTLTPRSMSRRASSKSARLTFLVGQERWLLTLGGWYAEP